MRTTALPLAVILLASLASAQTTYTVTTNVQTGRATVPAAERAFNIPLTNGAEINWLQVGSNTACSGQSAPFLGFVFLSFTTDCTPLTSVQYSGSFAGVRYNGRLYCSGLPTQLDVTFAGGSGTFKLSYYYSPYRFAGCYQTLLAGSKTVEIN